MKTSFLMFDEFLFSLCHFFTLLCFIVVILISLVELQSSYVQVPRQNFLWNCLMGLTLHSSIKYIKWVSNIHAAVSNACEWELRKEIKLNIISRSIEYVRKNINYVRLVKGEICFMYETVSPLWGVSNIYAGVSNAWE